MSPLTTASGRVIGGPHEQTVAVDPEMADAEREVADAEHDYEDAAADGSPGRLSAARKRLDSARVSVERIQAAARGRERREAEEAAALSERQQAARRFGFYAWAAEWARRAGPVLALRDELQQAEQHLAKIGPSPRVPGLKPWEYRGLWGGLDAPEGAVAARIPGDPTVAQDPTVKVERPVTRETYWHEFHQAERTREIRGLPVEVPLIRGDDRFDRLAQAIDRLADKEREAAGDQAVEPRWRQ